MTSEHLIGNVVNEPELISYEKGSSKLVFDLETDSGIHKCILWANNSVNTGQRILVKGFHKNGVFLTQWMLKDYSG